MNVIVCDNVSFSYGADVILNNISFSVNAGDKVGVIGVNGAGKTTLFSLIEGKLDPSGGSVFLNSESRIGVLEQINDAHKFGCTVEEAALSAYDDLIRMEKKIEDLHKRIESGDESLINAYTLESEKFRSSGGNEYRARTRSALAKFGFEGSDLSRNADSLSGGQKTKLLLVKLILSEPEIILLDEPTNHLDNDACEWLENYIISSKKTFLIISHDRYFLDKVTDHTVEIRKGVSRMYSGNYTAFREKRKKLEEDEMKHYELQQQEIARLEAFIEQQRRWNREKNIIAAESRQKTIDKMVKLEKPVEREKAIKFSIASSDTRSNDVLSVRDLSMSFSGEDLFSDLSFELKRGDRLFVYGANGCGKSTLLKILTGRLKQNAGVFELGYNQTIGYYDQEQKLLNEDNRVIDELWDAYSSLSTTKIRSMLASFGFYGDDVFKSVSVLSGGERARLSIAKMVSSGVSLLILDEPTNHLDIESRETLEEAIINYDGTVIAVSHDRYFISKLATRILEIDKAGYGKGYALYDNGFEGFLSVRKKKEIPARKRDEGAGKASFNESKQRKNRLRSAKSRCEAIEKEISVTESLLVELREKTEDGSIAQDYIKLTEVYDSISGAEAKIDELYSELDSLESEISELEE